MSKSLHLHNVQFKFSNFTSNLSNNSVKINNFDEKILNFIRVERHNRVSDSLFYLNKTFSSLGIRSILLTSPKISDRKGEMTSGFINLLPVYS